MKLTQLSITCSKSTKETREQCSKLTVKTTAQHIDKHLVLVFLLLFWTGNCRLQIFREKYALLQILNNYAHQIRITFADLMFYLLSLFALHFLENQSCIWAFVNFKLFWLVSSSCCNVHNLMAWTAWTPP